ncbi:hypothetical protein, partial [Microvirga sp. P5_D2]
MIPRRLYRAGIHSSLPRLDRKAFKHSIKFREVSAEPSFAKQLGLYWQLARSSRDLSTLRRSAQAAQCQGG